jgi:uncharacterized repeat protein (TIGR04076 family)
MPEIGSRKVRITVVKKLNARKILDAELQKLSPDVVANEPECPLFEVGDSFIVEEPVGIPMGFPCAWAFHDIYKEIVHLGFDGRFPCVPGQDAILACCTDGLRPVLFKLEAIGPVYRGEK